MKFPSIRQVAMELVSQNAHCDTSTDEMVDVRLQVYEDGQWAIRVGLSDYDQDHRGYWGSSCIPGAGKRMQSRGIARDLIHQAKDQYAAAL